VTVWKSALTDGGVAHHSDNWSYGITDINVQYSSVWCVGHCWAPGRRSVDQGSSVGSAAWVSEVFSKWHRAQGETGEDNFSSSGDGTISASGWSLEGISLPSPRAVGEY